MPKLPELLAKTKGQDMMSTMLINSFRPFLPRLQTGLTEAIEDADEDKIIKLVEFVDGVSAWLKDDN